MKKIYNLILLCVVAFVISSCSSSPSYISVIPSDVDALVSINVGSVIEKSGVSENQELLAVLIEAIESESSKAVSDLAKDILEDVNNSGIDFSEPIYTIFINNFKSEPIVVAKVAKKSDLTKLIGVLEAEGICSEILEAPIGGYEFFVLGSDEVVVAFNDDSLIGCAIPYGASAYDILEYTFDPLMVQSLDQSIAESATFKKMLANKFEAGGFIQNADALFSEQLTARELRELSENGFGDLSGVSAYAGVSFLDGEIVAKAETIIDNEKLKEKYLKYADVFNDVSGKFLEYIPSSAQALAVMSLDGEKVAQLIDTQMQGARGIEKMIYGIMGQAASIINEEITVAMVDNDKFAAYISINDKQAGIEILKSIESELGIGLKEVEAGQFVISLGRNDKIYINVTDEALCIAMDESVGGKVAESMADISYMSQYKGKDLFLYGRFDAKMIRDQFSREIRRNPEIGKALDLLNHVEISTEDTLSGEVHIVLNSSNENSLRVIASSFSELLDSTLR